MIHMVQTNCWLFDKHAIMWYKTCFVRISFVTHASVSIQYSGCSMLKCSMFNHLQSTHGHTNTEEYTMYGIRTRHHQHNHIIMSNEGKEYAPSPLLIAHRQPVSSTLYIQIMIILVIYASYQHSIPFPYLLVRTRYFVFLHKHHWSLS